ncbi:DUF2946 domain-containing protein [Bradyrhizobium sp. SSUT18]|uniref:DUF2946 domain-containing protein n=1 Tax=unclassified Bradyrhizobium TaxID=2631580 RepID=UPI002448DBD1|nr:MULTISPECIES: DUF2946 domain-containing protein [unclassified Bradyrhizobium]MDH2353564.1 DUF2946 domain-containing protein [Bradyrhizobium sp. SSUT112]MDH2400847.1 DUF2946 domain-containing protein [Bradyrhizobium sp. SSUT18]
MRARLQKFLPLVLLALVMQVLAPIAACLAAGQAVANPLSAAVICHSASEQGGLNDPTGTPTAHGAGCALCCLAQANASLDSPPQLALAIPFRHAERVMWRDAGAVIFIFRDGSNAQARAPPQAT